MKKIIIFFVLLLSVSSVSFAQEKNSALGLWLQVGNTGEGGGMDYKHLDSEAATDIYLSVSAYKNNFSLGGYLGYYFQFPKVIKADASVGKFPLYWGPVGGIGYWNNGKGPGQEQGIAVRAGVTGGISWFLPATFPMDISLELNPVAEYHFVSEKEATSGKFEYNDDKSGPEIPAFYIRLMFHAYLF